MTTQIEIYNQNRKRYRGGGLIGSIFFFIAWIGYVITRLACVTNEAVRTAVLAVLILAVIFQAYFALKNILLEREIKKDPRIEEALKDELVQLNELKAWQAAFFALIGFIIIAGIVSIFVQINDLMLILLTALLVGFGTHNTAVYLLNR